MKQLQSKHAGSMAWVDISDAIEVECRIDLVHLLVEFVAVDVWWIVGMAVMMMMMPEMTMSRVLPKMKMPTKKAEQ